MRILMIDDHALFRSGMITLLGDLAQSVDVDEASSGQEGLGLITATDDYDLVLLDLNLPDVHGLDLLGRVRRSRPELPLIVMSGEDDPWLIRHVIQEGAGGYIGKDSKPQEMLSAVRSVLDGSVYIPPHAVGASKSERLDSKPELSEDRRLSITDLKQLTAIARQAVSSDPDVVDAHYEAGRLKEAMPIVRNLVQEVHQERRQLKKLAYYDTLTELPNRRLFLDRLEKALQSAERSGQGLTLVYSDLDGFKQINDVHGHERGDELLRVFADRLSCAVREMDTVARLGGDEFTLILPGIDDEPEADKVLARIADHVMATADGLARELVPRASFGAVISRPEDTSADLLRLADEALYSIKGYPDHRYTIQQR